MEVSSIQKKKKKKKKNLQRACFPSTLLEKYEEHAKHLTHVHEIRKESTSLKNVAMDVELVESLNVRDTLGVRQPQDKFNGCVNLRTLRSLLKMIDENGFERCVLTLYSVVSESCWPCVFPIPF